MPFAAPAHVRRWPFAPSRSAQVRKRSGAHVADIADRVHRNGDNGQDQRLIRTILSKGIRFVSTVHEEQKPDAVTMASVPVKRSRSAL
jgi:hypothetical protein